MIGSAAKNSIEVVECSRVLQRLQPDFTACKPGSGESCVRFDRASQGLFSRDRIMIFELSSSEGMQCLGPVRLQSHGGFEGDHSLCRAVQSREAQAATVVSFGQLRGQCRRLTQFPECFGISASAPQFGAFSNEASGLLSLIRTASQQQGTDQQQNRQYGCGVWQTSGGMQGSG